MNKLEEDLKRKIQIRLEEEKRSSIEKAQIVNIRRLKEFFLGFVIWFISYSIFAGLQGKFRILIAMILAGIDILISSLGKNYDLPPDLVFKIRMSVIYILIILFSMFL